MKNIKQPNDLLFEQVVKLIEKARHSVIRTTNVTMVTTYFLIGRQIVEHEQKGEQRAQYAKKIIEELSQKLGSRFGKGFSIRNLEQMRKFYMIYKEQIPQNSSAELTTVINDSSRKFYDAFDLPNFTLSWSHYVFLCRTKNAEERRFYDIEATKNSWNLEELQRQFDTALYERLVLSTDKEKIGQLSTQGQIVNILRGYFVNYSK